MRANPPGWQTRNSQVQLALGVCLTTAAVNIVLWYNVEVGERLWNGLDRSAPYASFVPMHTPRNNFE
jgi:hypothetical protein